MSRDPSATPRRRDDGGHIWSRPEPGARRPRFSREQIAAAALAIADADGLDAVSMRRVAAALDAGTMTLYHYVRTKDDLLALMDDAIMGELLIPDGELSADWRDALTQIARRSRAAFRRHPWTMEGLRSDRVGPNAMRHFEQTLQAVAALDLPPDEQLELTGMVDDYVFGFTLHQGHELAEQETGGDGEETLRYVTALVETGQFPRVASLIAGHPSPRAAWEHVQASSLDEGRFERGLSRLLDGIQRWLETRPTGGTAPRAGS